MATLEQAARDFLAQRRIAVAGVSRKGDTAANGIYKKLRGAGYDVFAVNPHTDEVEGDRCYPDVASIPGGVEGVVVATHPDASLDVVRACGEAGVRRVWLHRSFGQGSVSDEAVRLCEELGLDAIPGSCPMMFLEPVDPVHRCFHWWTRVRGRQPAPQGFAEA